MSSLREIQQRAYRAILLDEHVRFGSANVDRHAARLGVYRNNARVTFEKTLAATYPVVQRLVGEPCFRGLALAFMREFPSRSGDLGQFGAELAALLDIYYLDTAFAYLADVARLEWAYAEAETAADAAPLDLEALSRIAPDDYEDLRFTPHPSARLVSSRYPVLSIWEAHQREDVRQVALGTGAEHVLVLRRGAEVRLHGLDTGTFVLARTLADGEPLASACEAGLAAAAELDLGTALAQLAALGVFIHIGRRFV
jgi:hypothetical protein